MKTLQFVAIMALSLGLTQVVYAEHDGKDGKHCDNKQCKHQHALQEADANKDGAISREEFNAAHQKKADKMFAKMDANNDGKIDQAERDAMHEKMAKHGKMKDHKMEDSAK